MKILGIIGSARKLGNTEILVKEALLAAQSEGAEVSLLRLSDLSVQPCNGCMACVMPEGFCRLEDDVEWLVEMVETSDGLVLGAPSYAGRPPGPFAVLEDRLIFRYVKGGPEKKAVTIGVAGGTHIAWWVVPQLNFLARLIGFEIVGSFVAGSQGPGEVLLPERATIIEEARRLGRDVARSIDGKTDQLSDGAYRLRGWNWHSHGYGEEKLFTVEDCCPFCFSEAFTFLHGDILPQNKAEVVCAFCHNSVGDIFIEDGKYVARLKTVKDEEGMRLFRDEHMKNWILPSLPLYKQNASEIKKARVNYKNILPWIKPPALDG